MRMVMSWVTSFVLDGVPGQPRRWTRRVPVRVLIASQRPTMLDHRVPLGSPAAGPEAEPRAGQRVRAGLALVAEHQFGDGLVDLLGVGQERQLLEALDLPRGLDVQRAVAEEAAEQGPLER